MASIRRTRDPPVPQAYAVMLRGTRMIVRGVRNKLAIQAQSLNPRGVHHITMRLNRP